MPGLKCVAIIADETGTPQFMCQLLCKVDTAHSTGHSYGGCCGCWLLRLLVTKVT